VTRNDLRGRGCPKKSVEFEVAAPGSVMVKRSCRKKEGAANVSISQRWGDWKATNKERPGGTLISSEVALSPKAERQRAKNGLLVLYVEMGLDTLES